MAIPPTQVYESSEVSLMRRSCAPRGEGWSADEQQASGRRRGTNRTIPHHNPIH